MESCLQSCLQSQWCQWEVGGLSKRQLAEIRQLLRSPPEAVKRILAACWLLLHCQRFKDKPISAVRFDEVQLKRISKYTAKWETFQDQKRLTKRNRSNTGYQTRWMSSSWIRDLQFPPFGQKTDWPRCQRMLVDEALSAFSECIQIQCLTEKSLEEDVFKYEREHPDVFLWE